MHTEVVVPGGDLLHDLAHLLFEVDYADDRCLRTISYIVGEKPKMMFHSCVLLCQVLVVHDSREVIESGRRREEEGEALRANVVRVFGLSQALVVVYYPDDSLVCNVLQFERKDLKFNAIVVKDQVSLDIHIFLLIKHFSAHWLTQLDASSIHSYVVIVPQ